MWAIAPPPRCVRFGSGVKAQGLFDRFQGSSIDVDFLRTAAERLVA
jgi:hypothetical protein